MGERWTRDDSWRREKGSVVYDSARDRMVYFPRDEAWPRFSAEVPPELAELLDAAQRKSLGADWDGYLKRPVIATRANLVRAALRLYLETVDPAGAGRGDRGRGRGGARAGGGGRPVSGWHRENPELVGTDDDPWMVHESYRRAVASPGPPPGMPSWAEIERMNAARCEDEECRAVQPVGPACVECGGPLGDNDY